MLDSERYRIRELNHSLAGRFHRILRTSLFDQSIFTYSRGSVVATRPPFSSENIARLALQFQGSAIGTIALERLKADPSMAAITLVAVDRGAQGNGHGRALLELTEAFAGERGLRGLVVNAAPHAVGFYESCGFQRHVWDQSTLDDWTEISGPPPIQLLKEI